MRQSHMCIFIYMKSQQNQNEMKVTKENITNKIRIQQQNMVMGRFRRYENCQKSGLLIQGVRRWVTDFEFFFIHFEFN